MYIIGTAGPNVKDKNILKGIIDSGVNALRFNFVHGNENEFVEFLKLAKEIDKNINVILDLSGSKIRVSNNFNHIYKIYNKEEVYFCGEDKYETIDRKKNEIKLKLIPLNVKNEILKEKDYKEISVKDNTMIFKVLGQDGEFIKAMAITGGIIRRGKGCNIKCLDRSKLSLNLKDKEALIWGIKNKVDIICQSFVEDRNDIKEVKDFIHENNLEKYSPKFWGKIETLNGVKNLKNILEEVDGIVIGRGDLIPETSIEDTPLYEEQIIKEVLKEKEKDIIIGTHILNSMKNGKMPTISEVESVYNFIKSGVTGFLLAGETSVGKAPIKTVRFLKSLINKYNKN